MKFNRFFLLTTLLSNVTAILADGPSGCGSNLTTLTVGTDTAGDLGYIPFEQKTGQTLTGFDIEVALEIAHRLGFQSTTFRQIPFSQLINDNPWPLLHELNKQTSLLDLGVAALSIIRRAEPLTNPEPAFTNTGFVTYNDDTLGVIISAKASDELSDPATFLQRINDASSSDNRARAFVITNSQENIIIDPKFFFEPAIDQYPNIQESPADTLQKAVNDFKLFAFLNANRSFLFLDSATAEALFNNKSIFPEGSVRLLTNVIDTKNVSPSQGLGVAVGGISTGSQGCQQLYANVAQAIKDMVADGTLARLRAQFKVSSSETNLGATSTPTTATPTINSNIIHNFYFTKYGTPAVIIGAQIPPQV